MSKSLQKLQSGFSAVEATLVVVAVVAVGFIGLRIMNAQNPGDTVNQTPAAGTTDPQVEQAPAVDDDADLRAAEEYVENTDVDGALNTSEIDEALAE